jgi:hypothetical protein
MSENRNAQMNTPCGVAVYPRLNEPDYKFDAGGVFSVTVRVPAEEGTELQSKLEKLLDTHHKKEMAERRKPNLKKAPLTVHPATDDEGNETGEIDFKFTMKHNVTTKNGKSWTQRPKLYDAKLQGFEGAVIGGGSKLIVNFVASPYYTAALGAGIKLRLNAVQVVELREYKSGNKPEDFGFQVTEGFQASEAEQKAPVAVEETPEGAAEFAEDEL